MAFETTRAPESAITKVLYSSAVTSLALSASLSYFSITGPKFLQDAAAISLTAGSFLALGYNMASQRTRTM